MGIVLTIVYHFLFIHEFYPFGVFSKNINNAKEDKSLIAIYSFNGYKLWIVRKMITVKYKYVFFSSIYYSDEFYVSPSSFEKIGLKDFVVTNGRDTLYTSKNGKISPLDSICRKLYIIKNNKIIYEMKCIDYFKYNSTHKPSISIFEKLTLGLLYNDLKDAYAYRHRMDFSASSKR